MNENMETAISACLGFFIRFLRRETYAATPPDLPINSIITARSARKMKSISVFGSKMVAIVFFIPKKTAAVIESFDAMRLPLRIPMRSESATFLLIPAKIRVSAAGRSATQLGRAVIGNPFLFVDSQ